MVPKMTIREHMVAYGLVSDEAFDRLISICGELQPDYRDELVSYLDWRQVSWVQLFHYEETVI